MSRTSGSNPKPGALERWFRSARAFARRVFGDHPRCPHRPRAKLRVEHLEDRTLPSVSLLGDPLLGSGAEEDSLDDPLIDPIAALEARILDQPKIDWGILSGFSDPPTAPNIQGGATGGTSAPASAGPAASGPVGGGGNQQEQQALFEAARGLTSSIQSSSLPGLNADDPPTVQLFLSDSSAGEQGPGTGQFTAIRSGGNITQTLTVYYSLSGSAANGTDYTGLGSGSTGSFAFAANETTKTITITPVQDSAVEGNETVVLTLTSDSSYTIGTPSSGTVTIADDPPVAHIMANDASAAEQGPGNGQFTITRSGGDSTQALTVYHAISGTATNSTDYSGLSSGSTGSVTIAANQSTATLTVAPVQDNAFEGNETVILTLTADSGYGIDSMYSSGTVGIADDPPVATITANDASAAEYGADPGQFIVTRSGGLVSQALTVNFTVGGTATRDTDYAGLTNGSGGSSWVGLAANATTATITVTPVLDSDGEGNETILLTLASSSSYQVGTPSNATVTIIDSPTVVSIAANDPTASEDGPNLGQFTVSRIGGDVSDPLTVSYSVGGTATNGLDYALLSGTVVLLPGQSDAMIDLRPIDDPLVEGLETVTLTLEASALYTLGTPDSATVSITDDGPVSSIGDFVWIDENANGVQDVSEPGAANVGVNLLADGVVVQATTTDDDGQYEFTVSVTLATYQVQIVLPAGHEATAIYAAAEDQDSNIDARGFTEEFTLGSGESNLTLDAGLVGIASGVVGGRLWLDEDADGIQDEDEPGQAGAVVHLRDVARSVIATTVTGADGFYRFPVLEAGTHYQIRFLVPDGYEPTQRHAGSADLDSDVDEYGFTDLLWFSAGSINGTLDAGLKAAAAPVGPVVEIRDAFGRKVNKLYVAKWENAFEAQPVPLVGNQVKADFIKQDPDRFFVYVIDAAKNTDPNAKDTFTVQVSTTSDTGNSIVMEETGNDTGAFVSRDLLLTSFVIDDEYQVNGIADNAQGDPTFLVKLNDTVTVTYGTSTATATVPIQKVVKLHINILLHKKLADGGLTVADPIDVARYVTRANQIYAQVGILFTATTVTDVDPPTGVDLSDGLTEYDGNNPYDAKGKLKMTDEEKALLGAATLRTAAKDDVEVYYVNYLAPVPGSAGEAFRATVVPDPRYADSIVSQGVTSYRVLAHEIGHILLDDGGHKVGRVGGVDTLDRVNLMAVPGQTNDTVTDSRRITAAQAKDILTKRPNLLKNP